MSLVVVVKFQFTHPGGVRPLAVGRLRLILVFQFTHPGGVRPVDNSNPASENGFNSRTREGCDAQAGLVAKMTLTVSIHAPGRGATSSSVEGLCSCNSFNSRTREGCDVLYSA